MRKRETSRKRAVETKKVDELNMEDKEATPVEEVEVITRDDQGDRQEPDKVTESVDMKSIMEYLKQSHEDFSKKLEESSKKLKEELNENSNKNLEKLKEELRSDNQQLKEVFKENSRKMEEKIDANNKACLLYTSRCV